MSGDLSPQLGGQLAELIDQLTGDEPMLSGRFNLARMGKVQVAFLEWMRGEWPKGDISLLDAWRWCHTASGNEDRCDRTSKRRYRELYYQYTRAYLARLLHSFMRRGLILVIKKDDGFSFIRARSGTEQSDSEVT